MWPPTYEEAWRPVGFRTAHPQRTTRTWSNHHEESEYTAEGNRYRPEDFSYTYNSRGFRCDELVPSPDDLLRVVCTGCSNTFGVGLPREEVWAGLLNTRLRERYGPRVPDWNVSEGGRSADWCARMIHHAVPLLKPDVVIALLPQKARREISDGSRETIHSWIPHFKHPELRGVHEAVETLYDAQFAHVEFVRSILMMEATARLHSARFFWASWMDRGMPDGVYPPEAASTRLASEFDHSIDFGGARDLKHCGPEAHHHFIDQIMEELGPIFDSIVAGRR